MDLTKYENIFAQESEKYLKELDDFLMRVEKDPFNLELWSEIHGKIHSIKGMARALSMDKISGLCHSMEGWAKLFQQGAIKATPNAVQLLFDGAELLGFLVARMGKVDSFEHEKWYSSLAARFEKSPEQSAEIVQTEKLSYSPTLSTPEKIDYTRIKYSLIDELLGLSQEILFLEKTLPPISGEQKSTRLKNWIDHYSSMLKGLYFRLAQLRLLSIADFADLFVKPIRNLAKEHNKGIRFEVIGGEVQADITLLERLREPFIHLFRNSIAHGIELPHERINLGKDPEGRITLEAKTERESLFIKVSDDGRGINRSAIIQSLKDKRSMKDEEIAEMSQDELLNTILSPGFSSALETTEMAGRGIGMNIVAQAIEYLGGTMKISSRPSHGTEFIIKLPIFLSITYSITFRIGKFTLSIPTSHVESIDRKEHISPDDSNSFYDLRGLLGVEKNPPGLINILKLRRPGEKSGKTDGGDGQIRLAVDSIIGNEPLMVMPVGDLLAKARIFAGVGVMENGDISILLDIENLPKVQGSPNH